MQTKIKKGTSSMSCLHWLGTIRSGIYFTSLVTGFWVGILAILKALIWPVFLVFEAFNCFNK